MTKTMETPRIYVACLASYNAGILHGDWIDCNQDSDEIEEEIQEILNTSPIPNAEEWAIHDHENWAGIKVNEFEDLCKLADIAEVLSEKGKAYAAFVEYFGEFDVQLFEEKYIGEWESEEDFTEERFRETNEIPSYLDSYIDWESMATDWFLSDYLSIESEGGYFIFYH